MANQPAVRDPLGYLVSPEAAMEEAEGIIRPVKREVKEIFSIVRESLGGFQTPRAKEDLAKTPELMQKEQDRSDLEYQRNFFRTTVQEINNTAMTNDLREIRRAKIIDVNTKLKYSNVQFEGTVNEDGSLRVDVQANIDQVNSEMSAEEVRAKRDAMLIPIGKKTGGFVMGENELNKKEGNSAIGGVGDNTAG